MSTITVRRAKLDDYDTLLRLIDRAFHENGPRPPRGFRDALPNLYCDPKVATRHAYLAMDGDRAVGHLGIYPLRLKVGNGIELTAAGVGAVGAVPDARGRGVMTALLNAASGGMRDEGFDLSVLWGDRLRYGRYGWESSGRRLQWEYDPRYARQAGVKPVALSLFEAAREIDALRESWNSDSVGTHHNAGSFAGVMQRKRWTVYVARGQKSGPLPFVIYQIADQQLIVDKIVGPESLLPGMLLHLRETLDPKLGMLIRCPLLDHPVARLGIQSHNGMSQHVVASVRVMNADAVAKKLAIEPASLRALDPAAQVRRLFGTPADGAATPAQLWIEQPSSV